MLTVKTSVRPSAIHGLGVFAEQRVLEGEPVWKFEAVFDRVISELDVTRSSPAFQDFLEMYAYRSSDLNGALILSSDNARYLNHSSDPNTRELRFMSVASRTIEIGDEITCDYGAFCSDGLGFDIAPPEAPPTFDRSAPPHASLYTRIRACAAGVGVFAIRDIPEGVDPFVGEHGSVVAVPVFEVEALDDENMRRMYHDFCPVIDDAFSAPKNFNELTIGWYLNHSKFPNVRVLRDMHFIAARRIRRDEELTTDYTTYSDHAERYARVWDETQKKQKA